VTADEVTLPAAAHIADAFLAHGFLVGRHTFLPAPAAAPRRVVRIALSRPLPALVPLLASPTALPGLGPALLAALYPESLRDPLRAEDPPPPALATLQLKAVGAFASLSAPTAPALTDALRALAARVRRPAWAVRPSAGRERRIVSIDGAWFTE